MAELIRVIDIGGSGFRRADVRGLEIIEDIVQSSGFKKIEQLFSFIRDDLTPETKGIAFAVAGVVKDHNWVVKCPNNRLIEGMALGDLTKEAINKPVVVCNDMEGAVAGMAVLLPDENYFMGITWSTGIGLRVWKDGRILSVAEAGHMVLDVSPFAPLCGCGRRGHVEAIISGQAVKRRVINVLEILGIELPENVHPCRFMDEAYFEKKAWAIELYKMIGQGMGIFLANIQSLLHLPLIVWKGTFAVESLKELEPIIRSAMKEHLIDISWAMPDVLRFQITPGLEDRDAFIGAAEIFRSKNV